MVGSSGLCHRRLRVCLELDPLATPHLLSYVGCRDDLGGNRYSIGCSAVVRVTLKNGQYHEDIGFGSVENMPGKGNCLDKVCLRLSCGFDFDFDLDFAGSRPKRRR